MLWADDMVVDAEVLAEAGEETLELTPFVEEDKLGKPVGDEEVGEGGACDGVGIDVGDESGGGESCGVS